MRIILNFRAWLLTIVLVMGIGVAYAQTKYEAEIATRAGGAKVNTDHTGFSGTGFVDGILGVGASATFSLTVTSAGVYNVTLRYSNGNGSPCTLSIYVNGVKIRQTSLPGTAGWDGWNDKAEALILNSGVNAIAYKYDSGDNGNVNLDYVSIPLSGEAVVTVTGVTVSPTSASVAINGIQQLTATVIPTNATNKNVTWSSSSTTIARVSTSGLVTGVATGSATITVTTLDGGQTATSAITVTSAIETSIPTMFQEFDPWTGTTSSDGLWRKAGPWVAGFNNLVNPSRCSQTSSYIGEIGHGFIYLTSLANSMNGAELSTIPDDQYSYGYYEVRMKVTGTGDPVANTGVCASFFLHSYANGFEPDFEFLTNGPWIGSSTGQVALSMKKPDGTSITTEYHDLSFNPKDAFHRYGFLWQPRRMDWTIDGQIVKTVNDASLTTTTVKASIMMNTWTGNPNWGGNPPTSDAVTVYDWVKFYSDVTSLPNEDVTAAVQTLDNIELICAPNPVVSKLNVNINGSIINAIDIFDVQGKLVKSINKVGQFATTLDLGNLLQGIYLLKVNTDKGMITKKIVKD